MSHLLSIRKFVIVLIAACLLAVAEHHHDDFEEHEDCPICVLIHDGYNLENFTPIAVVFWVLLFILQVQWTVVFWVLLFILQVQHATRNLQTFVPHYNPRGPPAIKT